MSTTTLGEFIIENQGDFKYATGELSRILSSTPSPVSICSTMLDHSHRKT